MKRSAALAVLAIALGACAAPTSFDGLTGGRGLELDDSLGAPRPMSPVSVSMVATSRPKLKWLLSGSLTGAIVEMSKSKEFLPESTKTFTASGSELVVPEDLEAGIWFWRLSGSNATSRGSLKSPIWEVLVRGPARFGASDAPSGSIVDINGDGIADLLTVGEAPGDRELVTLPFEMHGDAKGELMALTDSKMSLALTWSFDGKPSTPVTIAAGTDVDGDGISDFAYATYEDWDDGYPPDPIVASMPGSRNGLDQSRLSRAFLGFPRDFLEPTVSAAGDVDGDGYGDMIVGGGQVSYVARGAASGMTSSIPVFPIVDYPSDKRAGAVLGAFDADGDGISDLAVAQPRVNLVEWNAGASTRTDAVEQKIRYGGSPFASQEVGENTPGYPLPDFRRAVQLSSGIAKSLESTKYLSVSRAPAEGATAKSMTSGDFNGDGLADVATVMIEATVARVCVYFGSRDKFLVDGGCIDGIDESLGIAGITAGDLEGDGQDELLIASGGKVRSVHFDEHGGRKIEVVATIAKVASIATVWPGRPNQARWVVSDGNAITLFEGTNIKQRIPSPMYIVRGWGRVMR